MKLHCSEEDLIQNLCDAGCDSQMIEQFLDSLRQENIRESAFLLRRHRSALLDMVHSGQKKIDCLDYLIYQMKQALSQQT